MAQGKILAVDDNEVNLEILEEALGEEWAVTAARSGPECLEAAARQRPDVVLLDIMMPGMDGYEVCRRLRADQRLRHVKVIMVSAKAMTADRLRGYEAGADDYLTKPFEVEELRAKVRVHLRLKRAEEVDELKADVLALLHHKTRTPLGGVLMPLKLLLASPQMPEAERVHWLTTSRGCAERLLQLFEDVLRLCSLRAGKEQLRLSPENLAELAQLAVAKAQPSATARGVELACALATPARARLDLHWMRRVIDALLDNAIRLSPPGGAVRVAVRSAGEHSLLEIEDHGPGIAQEQQEQLFALFCPQAAEDTATRPGLSLAIAQQVVLHHGGTIEVESSPGAGATFRVRLPAIATAAGHAAASRGAEPVPASR